MCYDEALRTNLLHLEYDQTSQRKEAVNDTE